MDEYTDALRELFRTDPVEGTLFCLAPLLVAGVQLLNSAVNDLSLAVSVPFAVLVVVFSLLVAQYQLATHRLDDLEPADAPPISR